MITRGLSRSVKRPFCNYYGTAEAERVNQVMVMFLLIFRLLQVDCLGLYKKER